MNESNGHRMFLDAEFLSFRKKPMDLTQASQKGKDLTLRNLPFSGKEGREERIGEEGNVPCCVPLSSS